ncbi:hypothetical protein HZC09_06705 [Candidatus Micrarchaeota archaeon]|nr:hypothetical protein [Candidatus Micrarchaeota archaeon]
MNTGKVIACLKEMGFRPKIAKFSDKIVIQKVVYLLQMKGVKLDFDFGLYVRGPYSPGLTKEIYSRKGDFEQLKTRTDLSGKETEAVKELKEIFNSKSALLEIAATYAYFAYGQKQDPITAQKNVKIMKPFFSETQLAVGINKAKELLYRPTPEELEILCKELAPWQAAAEEDMRFLP